MGSAKDATRASGPARFWDPGRIRIALAIAMVLSIVLHIALSPLHFLPDPTGLEFKDPEGELSIPIDLLGEEAPPEPPPAPAPIPETNDPNGDALRKADAAPPPKPKDASVPDAEPLAIDAGVVALAEGGAPVDAGKSRSDAGPDDADAAVEDGGGLVAIADAGGDAEPSAATGPRDPAAMFGMKSVVNTGPQNVTLGVNTALIRKHPVGSRMGPILQSIPQWRDFLKGSQATVEPIRDVDWILIYGPSLRHTDRDAVLLRYNAPDEAVDHAVAAIARAYDRGGPFDAGVPGVSASRGHADNAERIFLRPRSKLLVIVPPAHAREAATRYKNEMPRGPSATEAMRLIVKNPSNQVSIPGLKFKDSLKEIRLWIIPRSDGGADIHAEGDCTDEPAAADTADAMTDLLRSQNSIGVRLATRGLLNNAKVEAVGTRVKLDITASQEQLEAILQLVAASLNAQVAPPGSPPGTPAHAE